MDPNIFKTDKWLFLKDLSEFISTKKYVQSIFLFVLITGEKIFL